MYTHKTDEDILNPYFCILHSMVSGRIVAGEAGQAEFFTRQGHGFEHSLNA